MRDEITIGREHCETGLAVRLHPDQFEKVLDQLRLRLTRRSDVLDVR